MKFTKYRQLFPVNSPIVRMRKKGNEVRSALPGLGGNKKRKLKKKSEKKKTYPVRRFKETIPIEDTNYVMEYSLSWDKVFELSKNKFKIDRNPKIEVHVTKTADMRDEFNSYCGRKKTIKNWLFYV